MRGRLRRVGLFVASAVRTWNALRPDQIETAAPTPQLSAKEQIEAAFAEIGAAIAETGLRPIRGRVHGDGSLLEAGARVLKTGKTEIVRPSGTHRTQAVCVFRTGSGSVAFQNLGFWNQVAQ